MKAGRLTDVGFRRAKAVDISDSGEERLNAIR
jgi:hypothetical protein